MDGKIDNFIEVAVCAVAEFCLRTFAAVNSYISAGSDCLVDLCKACALFSYGINEAVFVSYLNSGVHEKGVDEFLFFGCGKTCELFVNILLHNCCCTCHMRSCHGSTAHGTIDAAGKAGINIAAGSSDFRFDGKVGSASKAGEGGHKSAVCNIHEGFVISRNADFFNFLCHKDFAVSKGDHDGGNYSVNNHAAKASVNVVINNKTDCACCCCVCFFFSECNFATGNKSDFACNVKTFIVGNSAKTGNNNVFKGLAVEGFYEVSVCSGVAVGVLDFVFSGKNICGVILIFVYTCNGKSCIISGRRTYDTAVGVGSKCIAIEALGVRNRVGLVTCRNHEVDACSFDCAVNSFGSFVFIGVAAGAAKAHVDCINAENNCVFKCSKDNCIGCAAALIVENFHDNDLGIGSNAFEFVAVCADSTANVSTVVVGVVYLCIVFSIVECEGNFFADVKLVSCESTCIEVAGSNSCFDIGKGKSGICRSICKCLMLKIKTGIENCGYGAFTGVAVCVGNIGIEHYAAGDGCVISSIKSFGDVIGVCNINSFDTGKGLKICFCGIGTAYCKTVHNNAVVEFNFKTGFCGIKLSLNFALYAFDFVEGLVAFKSIHIIACGYFFGFCFKNGFAFKFNDESYFFVLFNAGKILYGSCKFVFDKGVFSGRLCGDCVIDADNFTFKVCRCRKCADSAGKRKSENKCKSEASS